MVLWPFQRVSLRTALPADVVLQRLAAEVEPRRWFRSPFGKTPHKRFEGEITGERFRVNRIIGYRNSFLPQVAGSVRSDGLATVLEATLMLHPVVAVFMLFWLGAVGLGGLGLLAQLATPGEHSWLALAPTGMFVFGYLLMQLAYLAEARPAKRFLEEVTREGGP